MRYYDVLVNLCNCVGLAIMTYLHQDKPQHTLPTTLTPFLPSYYSKSLLYRPKPHPPNYISFLFHLPPFFLCILSSQSFDSLNISSFASEEDHLPNQNPATSSWNPATSIWSSQCVGSFIKNVLNEDNMWVSPLFSEIWGFVW